MQMAPAVQGSMGPSVFAGHRDNWQFSLHVQQQPVRARMCGFGDKVSKKQSGTEVIASETLPRTADQSRPRRVYASLSRTCAHKRKCRSSRSLLPSN